MLRSFLCVFYSHVEWTTISKKVWLSSSSICLLQNTPVWKQQEGTADFPNFPTTRTSFFDKCEFTLFQIDWGGCLQPFWMSCWPHCMCTGVVGWVLWVTTLSVHCTWSFGWPRCCCCVVDHIGFCGHTGCLGSHIRCTRGCSECFPAGHALGITPLGAFKNVCQFCQALDDASGYQEELERQVWAGWESRRQNIHKRKDLLRMFTPDKQILCSLFISSSGNLFLLKQRNEKINVFFSVNVWAEAPPSQESDFRCWVSGFPDLNPGCAWGRE